MRVCLLVILILGLTAAPAAADADPLPAGTTVLPRDGQVWRASVTAEFVAYASDYEELPDEFAFAVATTAATDADGLLATPIRYKAPAQLGHPGIYVAPASFGTPGTYYWQASYIDDDGDTYASQVRTLTIAPQPPPDVPAPQVPVPPVPATPLPAVTPRPPDAGSVRIAVRRAIHAATHMVARGLVYRCTPAPAAATCQPSWRDVRFRYRGTLQLAFGTSPITARFTGTRTPRKHGHSRVVTWATLL
jgi:hypothetical protein